MQKSLVIVLSFALLFAFATTAIADKTQVDVYEQDKLVKSVVFIISKDEYFVNNQTSGVKMDAVPFIQSGRTFVPIRYLSNALGVIDKHIGWEKPEVTLSQPGFPKVELWVGKKEIASNGQTKTIDVAPLLRDGRTYLPARFVAEALGYQVGWDGENQVVLCWPKGEEKPDVSDIVEYVQGDTGQMPQEPQRDTYTVNGYEVPNETGLNITTNDTNKKPDYTEIGISYSIISYGSVSGDVEQHLKDTRAILESKFGNEAEKVMDIIEQKKTRDDHFDQWLTIGGQEARVYSTKTSPHVYINIWAEGV